MIESIAQPTYQPSAPHVLSLVDNVHVISFYLILYTVVQKVTLSHFTVVSTLFAGGGFHAMRQRLQSELNHLSAEDP